MSDTISQEIKILLQIEGQQTVAANIKLTDEQLAKLRTTTKSLPQATQAGTAGLSQMNNAIGQMGWALGDADMFIVNFRMGMMSIANNIPMVVRGLIDAKTAASGAGKSLGALAMESIMGPGGVMLAINGLMFLLNVLPGLFSDSTKKIEDQSKKVDELAESYKNLTIAQLSRKKSDIESELSEMTSEMTKKYGGVLSIFTNLPLVSSFGKMSDAELEKYTDLMNKWSALAKAEGDVGYLKNLQNEVSLLEKKKTTIKDPEYIHFLDLWIKRDKSLIESAGIPKEEKYSAMEKTIGKLIVKYNEMSHYNELIGISNKQNNESSLKQVGILLQQTKVQKEINELLDLRKKILDDMQPNPQLSDESTHVFIEKGGYLHSVSNQIGAMLDSDAATSAKTVDEVVTKIIQDSQEKEREANRKRLKEVQSFVSNYFDFVKQGLNTFIVSWADGHKNIGQIAEATWESVKQTALQKLADIINDQVFQYLVNLGLNLLPGASTIEGVVIPDSIPISTGINNPGFGLTKSASGNYSRNIVADKIDALTTVMKNRGLAINGEDFYWTQKNVEKRLADNTL